MNICSSTYCGTVAGAGVCGGVFCVFSSIIMFAKYTWDSVLHYLHTSRLVIKGVTGTFQGRFNPANSGIDYSVSAAAQSSA